MPDEQKPVEIVKSKQELYREKIGSVLENIAKTPAKPTPEPVVAPVVSPVYVKMKELGIKKGMEEFFKLEESQFDTPSFVTEELDDQVVGTKLFRVRPPSNYPDADKYWHEVSPYLKRIGPIIPHEGDGAGELNLKTVSSRGEEEILEVILVRDEDNGDKPTLVFEYRNRDDITPEEVFRHLEKSGLKVDRLNSKKIQGIVVVDALAS
jgi:hypothetical protein